MRTFIGVDFSKELKNELADMQSKLRKLSSAGRWKYVDNFHLTLKFLGYTDPAKVDDIKKILQNICRQTQRFELYMSELDFFPGRGNIRVLWLGMDGDLKQLNTLQSVIEDSVQSLGYKKENKGFTPHITIGQDIVFDKDFGIIRNQIDLSKFPKIKVESVHLFNSEQIGNKRVYTSIIEEKLV